MSVTTADIGQKVFAKPTAPVGYLGVSGKLVAIDADQIATVERTTTKISRHGLATDGGTYRTTIPARELETQAERDARNVSTYDAEWIP